MIISVESQKAFDKIQNSFMIKTRNKWGIEGNFLNLIKDIYKKQKQDLSLHHTQWWKTECFLSMIKNKNVHS